MNSEKPYLISFPKIGAASLGFISIAEKENLPFVPKRIYWTYATPQEVERGNHSHKELEQLLIAVAGKISIKTESLSGEKEDFVLDSPNMGLYLPKRHWRTITYSENAVQLCIASMEYNEDDYIREYNDFK
ncbi:sugar 3,4-ketoisomerase [Flavobacterium kingsejongi]|uniref:dTDP-6-deoxy-3,4-keto-hexulose isomerase n=1 Tax=Flavobacterium kingsejongi TaxID=1678728 RepID=A0A2S1LQD1_9FLAO|nr:FdtA/QdtA family cupin domain-containing protein [Flavobacterium kingsejongi]AWG25929.1 dTDP-6-deoxy-3,4-keto-hexulose isomerase [Flavobacterium kingsejongi]